MNPELCTDCNGPIRRTYGDWQHIGPTDHPVRTSAAYWPPEKTARMRDPSRPVLDTAAEREAYSHSPEEPTRTIITPGWGLPDVVTDSDEPPTGAPPLGTHRWLGSDYGAACYACGMALDYLPDPSDFDALGDLPMPDREALTDAAHRLAPACTGPATPRAHHYVLISAGGASGFSLDCAYGDSAVGDDTEAPTEYPSCIGA